MPIDLMKSETREPSQVIELQKTSDELFVGAISGKYLIQDKRGINQLWIFKRTNVQHFPDDDEDKVTFEQYKRIILKENPEFKGVTSKFIFANNCTPGNVRVIFIRKDMIFEFNVETEVITPLMVFPEPINDSIQEISPTDDNTCFLVNCFKNCYFIDTAKKTIEDITEEKLEIEEVEDILWDDVDECWYVLVNKMEGKYGFFVFKYYLKDMKNPTHLIKWVNKLNIGDCNMAINDNNTGIRELVISYKVIYINTYNVMVLDLSPDLDQRIVFRHESSQVWESDSCGFFLSKSEDYIKISKNGLFMLSMGDKKDEKEVIDEKKMPWMSHSLESMDYLKVYPTNYMLFNGCKNEETLLQVQQEYYRKKRDGSGESMFQTLTNIKLKKLTLRELLIFYSLYLCETNADIFDVMNDQPNSSVFLKSSLDLNGMNMASILSFDTRSMTYILENSYIKENKEMFYEFPVFYLNKMVKGNRANRKNFYRNPVEQALRVNQVGAV